MPAPMALSKSSSTPLKTRAASSARSSFSRKERFAPVLQSARIQPMQGRFLRSLVLSTCLFLALTIPARGAASYKHWRAALKAAQESRLIRDYDNARETLEKSAPEAAELGPESSAENS